jgi:hypothetical protein
MWTIFARGRWCLLAALSLLCMQSSEVWAQSAQQHDGAHDFEFLIGDWKAHVRRLPERLAGATSLATTYLLSLSTRSILGRRC